MRLKSFIAQDIATAMEQVRRELGENAIVVSSRQSEKDGEVSIIAAIERPGEAPLTIPEGKKQTAFADSEKFTDHLTRILHHQNCPRQLMMRLLTPAARLSREGPVMALATALDEVFRFAPLELPLTKPLILVGPNGSGKTTVAAKLAVRAHTQGRPFKVISTDTVRAGAIEQIACFTRILKADLAIAGELRSLMREIESARNHDLVVIDTPGANPRSKSEMTSLAHIVKATGAEPLLVMAAGGDTGESAEAAMAFSVMSPQRLVVTRLDTVKRLGGVLSAAQAASLRYANVSVSASVASNLKSLNPVSLARMLAGDASTVTASAQNISLETPLTAQRQSLMH